MFCHCWKAMCQADIVDPDLSRLRIIYYDIVYSWIPTYLQIFCSDLGRTKETLRHIGYTCATFDKRLRERDFGSWSGKLWSEYIEASKNFNNGTFKHNLFGVESGEELNRRLLFVNQNLFFFGIKFVSHNSA